MVYGGKREHYLLIASQFIHGEIYNRFVDMSLQELRACYDALQELHSYDVVHGDVRAPNFVIENAKSSSKYFFYRCREKIYAKRK
jgi:tRNA A-37 threonylcarbamoyl transferase component Bud32